MHEESNPVFEFSWFSMRIALQDLRLDSLDVIHAGRRTFPLAKDVRAVSIDRVLADIRP